MDSLATQSLSTCLIGLQNLRNQELKDFLPVPAFRLLFWTNLSYGNPRDLPLWVS